MKPATQLRSDTLIIGVSAGPVNDVGLWPLARPIPVSPVI